jgi:hypothetical protein
MEFDRDRDAQDLEARLEGLGEQGGVAGEYSRPSAVLSVHKENTFPAQTKPKGHKTMEKYIVTVVHYGETCNGKAEVLGVYSTYEDARTCVHADIENWCDVYAGESVECDFDKMSAQFTYDTETRCEWNISTISL